MALTGQLSDMSLAELIEFFCNQRKTGRLKIDYPRGHSVFFIKEGELVDAKVGALSGSEAVYFSLTLPNAAFDFSPDVQATRRTIHNAWTQVVLEGLRRLDEGLSPTEGDAFGAWSPSETELAQMLDQVEHLDSVSQSKSTREKGRAARAASQKDEESAVKESSVKDSSPAPFSMMVESASAGGGSKKKFVLAGVAAAVVLACAVAAVPLLNRAPAKTEAATVANLPAASAPAEPAPAEAQPAEASGEAASAAPESTDAAAAADAAHRDERERKERERRRREEAAKKEEAASTLNTADPAAAPKPSTPSGPKAVRVTITYDEAGRVTAASVAGATPGAEAYGSTAVRIARGKRFPAGKPGSTVVTIPVN
jgi:TonB family protein